MDDSEDAPVFVLDPGYWAPAMTPDKELDPGYNRPGMDIDPGYNRPAMASVANINEPKVNIFPVYEEPSRGRVRVNPFQSDVQDKSDTSEET